MKANSFMKKSASLLMAASMMCSVLPMGMTASAAKTPKKYVQSMTVSPTKVTLNAGKSKKVKVKFKVVKSASKKFTVKTSNKKVATAKVSGAYVLITAKSPAKNSKATITVTSKGKNKKNKYISKKIAVTVKAKKVEKVDFSVSISPETITVGGKAKITVTPTKSSAAIKTITYKSSNTAVATVSKKGNVTGVAASATPVVISVTAAAATGKAVTKSVSLTVKEADSAKITGVNSSYTLAIGESVKLNPIAENTQPMFHYASSNASVATVSAEGMITAVSAGNAQITVTIPGTSAVAVCAVTVSKTDLSIVNFTATHSDRLTVILSSPVSKANQDKLKIELSKGSVDLTNSITVIWSEDGKSFDITTGSDFDPASYSVKITSDNLAVNPNANTLSAIVAERKITKVEITNARIAKINGAKVYFNAIDNYGDAIPNVKANDFNWNIECSEVSVNVNEIAVDKSKAGYISFDNIQGIDSIIVDSTSFSITARSIKEPDSIYTTKKIDIKSLLIDSINLKENSTKIYQKNTDEYYTLNYEAKDQFGDDIDWSLYNTSNSAYNNKFESSSSDENIVSAPVVYEGKLVVMVKAGKFGKSTISVSVGSKYSSITFEVLEAAKPVKIEFPEYGKYSLIAGDDQDIKIPVTFIDQYGEKMLPGTVKEKLFNSVFDAPKSTVPELITGYAASSKDGDSITINAKNVKDHGKATLTYAAYDENNNYQTYNYTIEITPKRKANSINIVSPTPVPSKLVVGEKVEFGYEILDNNGTVWTKDDIIVEMVSSNKHYIDIEDMTMTNGKGKMFIKAINKSYDTQDKVYLTFNLFDKSTNELIATTEGNTTYPVTVYDNVQKILVTTDAEGEIMSGQAVKLTCTAYNNDVVLEDYDKEFEQIEFKEYVNDTFTGNSKYETVKFVNGVATVTLYPKTVGNVVFKATIPTPGRNSITITTSKNNPIKVVPGPASKYVISLADNALNITCYDQNNNVKTDYKPTGKTFIKLELDNSTVTANEYIKNVDAGNEAKLTFTDGVASLQLKKSLDSIKGAKLTVTTGDITVSMTVQ